MSAPRTAAAVGIHALIDLDRDNGDVVETLTTLLLGEGEGAWFSIEHEDSLRLLLGAITDEERAELRLALDICPVHVCDIAICADDDNSECAHIRAQEDGGEPQ